MFGMYMYVLGRYVCTYISRWKANAALPVHYVGISKPAARFVAGASLATVMKF